MIDSDPDPFLFYAEISSIGVVISVFVEQDSWNAIP